MLTATGFVTAAPAFNISGIRRADLLLIPTTSASCMRALFSGMAARRLPRSANEVLVFFDDASVLDERQVVRAVPPFRPRDSRPRAEARQHPRVSRPPAGCERPPHLAAGRSPPCRPTHRSRRGSQTSAVRIQRHDPGELERHRIRRGGDMRPPHDCASWGVDWRRRRRWCASHAAGPQSSPLHV